MIRVVAFINNPRMHLSALQRSVIDPEALRQGNFLNDFAIFLLLCNQLNTIIYVGVHGKGLRSNRPDLRHLLVFFCHSFCSVGCGFFFSKNLTPSKSQAILAHLKISLGCINYGR